MSYRAGPAGHYREHGPFDDALPLERQLAAERDRASGVSRERHVSAAYLPFDGLGSSCIGFVPPGVLDMNNGMGPEMPYAEWVKFLEGDDAGLDGLGDISTWTYPALHMFKATGVYVVRLKCTGLPLHDGKDLLLFVRALGLSQTLGFDVRGATAWQDPGAAADAWWVDVIATVTSWGVPSAMSPNDAGNIADAMQRDASLRAQFPSLQIDTSASYWGELTGPAQAVDFWQSQPLLWDHNLPGPKCVALFGGCGGPTNTFPSPPASSISKGKADDGALATPFPVTGVVPIAVADTTSKDFTLGTIHVVGAAALVGALGLGYYYFYGKKKGRTR